MTVARPLAEWTEEDGDVLWWFFPMTEAPWIGSPLSCGHTVELWTRAAPQNLMVMRGMVGGWPGYHTHWTPLPPIPTQASPRAASGSVTRQAAGGHARAANLSPERRSEIARQAASARWNDQTNH